MPGTQTTPALDLLRRLTRREDAEFRDGQLEAIERLVEGRGRVLCVQRTGWGKSAVYFVATAMLRERGAGPTILVSPLIALMRNQLDAAEALGIRAATVNSSNREDWEETFARIDRDEVDLLLLSPERLANQNFRATVLPKLVESTGLLVIDEAHCISDWGHDFRPDYRRLRRLLADLPSWTPVLATTATANQRVTDDVAAQLGDDTLVLRTSLDRASLRLSVVDLPDDGQRLAWLAQTLDELPGSGIIYCLTVDQATTTAEWLRSRGHDVAAYTGAVEPDERLRLESALRANELKALVATSALGMGFDKPDLGFVVHLGAPSSPVAYYQQVGRAGRATERADVLLLPGVEDRDIWHWFATNAMPTQARADAVLAALADADRPLSVAALEARVDLRRGPLELLLKVLAVDGAVEYVPGGWLATGQPWVYDAERYQRIAEARVAEQDAMLAYEQLANCRMAFLTEQLDDP
ncbi:MAG: RecQ family ATP-dependent DNA helicase, partial [Solirubrobacterales bacterium]|nr:RecQ family ATP-dependent DNA helicase [Solirubrobacterales bacterium]